jgi:hypothetical protein
MKEQYSDDKPGAILDDAFHSFPDINLPDSFTDELVKRIEARLTWKLLLTEFGLKIALVILTLGVFAAWLLFPFKTLEGPFLNFLLSHWQIIMALTGIFFFTFLFDQVVLRYLFHRARG